MSGDWKPGDVAMVTGRWVWSEPHSTRRAFRDTGCWTTGTRDVMDHEVSDIRPLVVIDTEDAEQVKRLTELCAFPPGSWVARDVQAALREFAAPTPPKPEEPRGLGAVVEDARGDRWVRLGDEAGWRRDGYTFRAWDSLDQVAPLRVLSEGVTP